MKQLTMKEANAIISEWQMMDASVKRTERNIRLYCLSKFASLLFDLDGVYLMRQDDDEGFAWSYGKVVDMHLTSTYLSVRVGPRGHGDEGALYTVEVVA